MVMPVDDYGVVGARRSKVGAMMWWPAIQIRSGVDEYRLVLPAKGDGQDVAMAVAIVGRHAEVLVEKDKLIMPFK
jgi:hypothetical protein